MMRGLVIRRIFLGMNDADECREHQIVLVQTVAILVARDIYNVYLELTICTAFFIIENLQYFHKNKMTEK